MNTRQTQRGSAALTPSPRGAVHARPASFLVCSVSHVAWLPRAMSPLAASLAAHCATAQRRSACVWQARRHRESLVMSVHAAFRGVGGALP
eukprot:1435359-Pleurochrysis_carterae.AAC.1